MQVYKFGGASIATPAAMAALLPIIQDVKQPLLLVVSAMGKTTNALEQITNLACNNNIEDARLQAKQLQQQHLAYSQQLLNPQYFLKAQQHLGQYFQKLEFAIASASATNYDCSYDQIVCLGEIFSSCLFSLILSQYGMHNQWVDARQVIHTDDTYRDAVIDWGFSQKQAQQLIGSQLQNGNTVITQGFIGSSGQGKSVTLGREGSDYTAAVLAAMLQLDAVTIWKDVDGFRNADPKQFAQTQKIDAISYNEVIEMAFYGAQIIHPKTIKPLQNNNIPLYVKCFLDKNLSGTIINAVVPANNYPPLIVLKENQVLLQVTTRDFSFITEENLSKLYKIFHELKIKVNIIQNAAISFVTCIDNQEDKIKALISKLNTDYKVLTNHPVSLLTIRHFTPSILAELTIGKQILLKQETRKTVQVVMK